MVAKGCTEGLTQERQAVFVLASVERQIYYLMLEHLLKQLGKLVMSISMRTNNAQEFTAQRLWHL